MYPSIGPSTAHRAGQTEPLHSTVARAQHHQPRATVTESPFTRSHLLPSGLLRSSPHGVDGGSETLRAQWRHRRLRFRCQACSHAAYGEARRHRQAAANAPHSGPHQSVTSARAIHHVGLARWHNLGVKPEICSSTKECHQVPLVQGLCNIPAPHDETGGAGKSRDCRLTSPSAIASLAGSGGQLSHSTPRFPMVMATCLRPSSVAPTLGLPLCTTGVHMAASTICPAARILPSSS